MTDRNLTAPQINKLAQRLTNEKLGRAANADKAARRFARLLADRIGEDRAHPTLDRIFASTGFETAEGALIAELDDAASEGEALWCETCGERAATAILDHASLCAECAEAANAEETAEAEIPRPKQRAGTKQATLIDMLRAPGGATLAELSDATGWQPHTVRGAIAGALKKRLGLHVTAEKVEGRGRVYTLPEGGPR